MIHGEYIGKEVHLRGKGAMLRIWNGIALAQFDDTVLTLSGVRTFSESECSHPEPPKDALGFGWHLFSARDFVYRLPY